MALHDPPIEVPFVDVETGMVTRAWQEWLIINKRDKANRYESAIANNIALLDGDGHPIDSNTTLSDQVNDSQVFANLVTTKLIASDGSGGITEIDLDDWVTAGVGVTVTDDGDGTITIVIKQQANIVDASIAHSITDPGDTPADADTLRDDLVANAIPDMEAALNALGAKINAILALLLASEQMAAP